MGGPEAAHKAMALWRRAYRMCPQLEETGWHSHDGGQNWSKGADR